MSRKKIKQELEKITAQCEEEGRTFIAVVETERKNFKMYLRGDEAEIAYSCGEILKRVSRALGVSAVALADIVTEVLKKEEEIKNGTGNTSDFVGKRQSQKTLH